MKTTIVHLSIALLAGAATAREPQGNRPPPQPPRVPPILMIFDEDHDGVISEREVRHASKSLGALDRNGDGQITREELMPPPPEGEKPAGPPPGHRPPPLIAALDTNKDGKLSAEELEAAPESLLELDKNGDGELSSKEFIGHGPPPPPPHQDGPRGGPGETGEPE